MIIGTLNRPLAIRSCIESIKLQKYTNYEIIIIDQSDDNSTEEYICSLNDPQIIYRHVNYKGLSKARNEGLSLATGEYFCLIDDDAYYDKNYLLNAMKNIGANQILSGYIFDTTLNRAFANYKEKKNHKTLSVRMIMKTCPSAGLVIPMRLIKKIGNFDDNLGVGSEFPAGEETDLLLRAIKVGYSVKYVKELQLKHPYPVTQKKQVGDNWKIALYYKGLGAMYKKNLIENPSSELIICYLEIWIRLIIKCFLFFKYDKKLIQKYINEFKKGYNSYN